MRLRKSSPHQPGWTRRRAGKGFVFLDQDGQRLTGEDAERCKALVIPPAWKDVWICPFPNGHLQAVGTDEAGRRQYIYHPAWVEQRSAEKYDRVLRFGKRLPRIRERVVADLALGDDCLEVGARSPSGCSTSATSGSATTSTPRSTDPSASPRWSAATCGASATCWSSSSPGSRVSSTASRSTTPW